MKKKKTLKKKKKNYIMIGSLLLIAVGLTALSVINQKQSVFKSNAATTYLSLIYYPGWVQQQTPPSAIDYSAFTHIIHFGFYPTATGTISLGDMQDASYPASAISAAHNAGKKIILVIGGEGSGSKFVSATQQGTRAAFVTNIVNTMKQYGYDGVDIDWEESVTEAPFVSLVQELRTSLDTLSPHPWLSIDVDQDLHPAPIVAKAAPYVDYINLMTYWDNGASTVTAYTDAGVPINKMILGLALTSGSFDASLTNEQGKIDYVKQHGMPGVMGWQLGDFNTPMTDPRLQSLRNLIASSPTSQPSISTIQPSNTVNPTFSCMGGTNCTPSVTPTIPAQPTTGITPITVTLAPTEGGISPTVNQNQPTAQPSPKNNNNGNRNNNNSIIQQLINFIMQLIALLLQAIGVQK